MFKHIKRRVSENRQRYTYANIELDLSYITNRIIAMSFPGQGLEGMYRNHVDDVKKFLDERHGSHYKVFNLRSEKGYDNHLQNQSDYAFDDHQVPTLDLMNRFCTDAARWLDADNENIVVVHCKAGKGRTGLMIAVLLLYTNVASTADDAMRIYGSQRTIDGRGITVPSQARYIRYFEAVQKQHFETDPRAICLIKLVLTPIPVPFQDGRPVYFVIKNHAQELLYQQNDPSCDISRSKDALTVNLLDMVPVKDDFQVQFHCASFVIKTRRVLSCWLNTQLIRGSPTILKQDDLDDACNNKTDFAPDFTLEMHYTRA
ncbi:protein-tyrosine phosphatase-like protein [Gongronella butleri]|nr:protein-tyrosine phosphatase-like protein [Gongronella butleri]